MAGVSSLVEPSSTRTVADGGGVVLGGAVVHQDDLNVVAPLEQGVHTVLHVGRRVVAGDGEGNQFVHVFFLHFCRGGLWPPDKIERCWQCGRPKAAHTALRWFVCDTSISASSRARATMASSSPQSPLCSGSACRRNLRPLPCGSSPNQTRFAGLWFGAGLRPAD